MIGYLQIVIFFLFWIISFCIFNFELFSPASLICGVVFIGSLAAEYLSEYINYNQSGYSCVFISLGLITFITTSLLTKKYCYQLKEFNISIFDRIKQLPKNPPSKFICIMAAIVAIFLVGLSIKTLLDEFGLISLLDFSEIGENMRDKDVSISLKSKIILNISNILYMAAYIFSILYMKHKVFNNTSNKYLLLSTIVIVFCFIILLSLRGGRLAVFASIASFFVAYYMIWHIKNDWRHNINPKYFLLGIYIFIFSLFMFVAIKPLIGRGDNKSLEKSLVYIAHYAGGGIVAADWLFSNQEVYFPENIHFLKKIRRFPSGKITHRDEKVFGDKGFFYVNQYKLGNVYTPAYRYYHDLGVFGIIIGYAITAFLFNYLYYYLKRRKRIGLVFVFYHYLLVCLFLQAFDDYLFNYILSPFIIQLFFHSIIVLFLIGKNKTKKINI